MSEEETEPLENVLDVNTIKKRIEDNRSTLLSVVDANDLLLTELVGEEVLDESIQDEILAGSTRSEINKRLLKWLMGADDRSTFEIFLTKLRKHGQSHVANLLDGTPGELPLKPKDRQRIKKTMGDLVKKVNLDSGLLDTLHSVDAISDMAYEQISTEKTHSAQAKALLDALLRGSDEAFEKFELELLKNQPEALAILEQEQQGRTTPHVDALNVKFPVLKRCTDVNRLTISFLRADGVIDDELEDKLKSQQGLLPKVALMQRWLIHKPADTFNAYIQVMQKSEQRHVANLLTNNSSGQQPLSEERFQRLKRISPHLIMGIFSRGVSLASALRGQQASDDTDFAISNTDCEAITQEQKDTDRNSILIDAVLRRTDFSFDCLERALRDTKQDAMADLLTEGEVIGAHLNTTRPDKEDAISKRWNDCIVQQNRSEENQDLSSSSDASPELRTCFEENPELRNLCNELNAFNLQVIATESQHSIMVYTYCKTPDDMKNYVRLLKSGQLQSIFENILNQLLKSLEPEDFQPMEVAVALDEEAKMLIEEFTGLDKNQADVKDLPCISKETCKFHDKPMNIYCFDCKELTCSSCIDRDHQSHRHSDARKTSEDLREQLQKDVTTISNCKSKSLQWKEKIENDRKQFIVSMESSEKAVLKYCEDLKQRIERFKDKLLQERATFKQQVLQDMDNRKRAIESYVAVFKDYEEYARKLMQQGSPSDICQSFAMLHNRAEKLQQTVTKPVLEKTDEFIIEHRQFLEERMDPDSGLLEQLHAFGVPFDMNEVMMSATAKDKNKKILDFVIKDNKFKELRFALVNSNQRHLVNYVCSNGEYEPYFGDDWPLMDQDISFLDSSKGNLIFLFETCDLLTMLCSMGVINSKQKEFVASSATPHAKSDALLVILKRGSLSDLKKLPYFLISRQVLHQEVLQPQPNPIEQHRAFIEQYMDPDFGLLELSLPSKEAKKIKSERSLQKRNAKLLDFILKHDKYKELMIALARTKQTHIVNFLNANGVYDPKFGGDWPLTIREIQILEANRKYLVDHIQSGPLLDKLLSAEVISKQQKDFISHKQGFRERNEALLDMLKRGSWDNYRKTVECLLALNQSNIAKILGQFIAQSQVNVTIRVTSCTIDKEVAELVGAVNQLIASRYSINQNTSSPGQLV